MAQKFLQSIDLNGLELQNAVLQPLGTPPDSPSIGRMYFHSTDGKPYWYDGSKYITFPLLSDVTTLQGYFTNGKANDALKLGGVALDGLFTALSTSTTNAVSITVGGISKNITVADLKTSLGLKGLAYKDSLDLSDIPAIPWDKITANTRPTTLSGYGITNAIIYDPDIDISDVSANNIKHKNLGYGYQRKGWHLNAPALSLGASSGYVMLIQQATDKNTLYVSRVSNGVKSESWDALISEANKDEYLTDYLKVGATAASAEKLANTHTIWGQPFDGTQDVKGVLNHVDSISFTNDNIGIDNSGRIYIRSSSSGGWARSISYVDRTSNKTTLGVFGARGSTPESLSYLYMGTAYDSENTLRVYSNGSVTIGYNSNILPTAKLYVNGSVKIGGATFTWDETNDVLIVDKPFASTGAISTKGVGSSSGGGGSVDLTNIVSNILPASGSITSGVSSYNIGATDKRWGTVYANVGNFNNLSASGFSAQSINASTINVGGVRVATLTDINDAKAYAQQVANEAANSIYNTLLGGEVDESLDTIKEILDYVKDLDSENIVVKKTSTITGTGEKKSFDFQHNLNTKDVIVFVYEVSNPYQQVFVDVKITSTSTITVEFAEAPANETSYKVVVMA